MTLNEQFQNAVNIWEEHCGNVAMSSNPADYEDPTASQAIAEMGKEAIPSIKAHLETKTDSAILPSAWLRVIRKITGEESDIPKQIQGNMEEIRAHLIDTLN